jgi:hypothetical protein
MDGKRDKIEVIVDNEAIDDFNNDSEGDDSGDSDEFDSVMNDGIDDAKSDWMDDSESTNEVNTGDNWLTSFNDDGSDTMVLFNDDSSENTLDMHLTSLIVDDRLINFIATFTPSYDDSDGNDASIDDSDAIILFITLVDGHRLMTRPMLSI